MTFFLFCSEPIKKNITFTEYNSNTRNNVLWFRDYVFLIGKKKILKNSRVREYSREYTREYSVQRLFSRIL
jgi:hypothetical protein